MIMMQITRITIIFVLVFFFGCNPKKEYINTENQIKFNDNLYNSYEKQDSFNKRLEIIKLEHNHMLDSIVYVYQGEERIADKSRERMVDSLLNLPPDTIHNSKLTLQYYNWQIEKEKNKQ